jgi:hypothetical protein
MIEVELFPAQCGDCIWLRYGPSAAEVRHILIDTGFVPTAELVRKRLHDDPKIKFELFVMTHIDADHIEGSAMLFQDAKIATPERFKNVWFNGWDQIDSAKEPGDELGAKQGEYLSALLRDRGLAWNEHFPKGAVMVPADGDLPTADFGGLTLTLLSPTLPKLHKLRSYWMKDLKGKLAPGDEKAAMKLLASDKMYALDAMGSGIDVKKLVQSKYEEDTAPANGSSIAFLASYDGKRLLFTGDAHPGVLVDSVERLGLKKPVIDLFKVPHHGSKHNTSADLLRAMKVRRAVFSTNGKKFKHPDLECVARVVDAKSGELTLCFNYATEFTTPWKEKDVRKANGMYDVEYGDEGALTIRLD